MKKIKVENDEEFIKLLEEDHIEQMIQEATNLRDSIFNEDARDRDAYWLRQKLGVEGAKLGVKIAASVTTAVHGNGTAVAHRTTPRSSPLASRLKNSTDSED
ncbi:hypothetical protein PIB30_059716 [Stylosanthes scabra]|uniref:Uncharacterized protein n=1 Tax=Stylosanthes scabra TaxID=79078 RepID=A0ABU6XIC9_9FABA|nr:hypothetical protein [Stylosanthes scabra]